MYILYTYHTLSYYGSVSISYRPGIGMSPQVMCFSCVASLHRLLWEEWGSVGAAVEKSGVSQWCPLVN